MMDDTLQFRFPTKKDAGESRMKQKKKLTILLTLGAMMFALTGCGMNAEKLVEKTLNALEEKQMTQATGIYEMEIGMEVEGNVMKMDMEMSMDTKACQEPYASFVDMEMKIDVSGLRMTETVQSYTLVEDGTLVSYTHTDSTDTWLKQESGMNLEEVMAQTDSYNWLAQKASEDLVLAKETQTINDREVYVLSCTLTGEEMQKTLDNMGSMKDLFNENGLGEVDFTALSVPTVFYIDKETFLPVKIEMDIEGMSDMMDSMVTSLLGGSGVSIEMELDISKMHMVLDNIGYDKIEVPTVPEEGLIAGNQESNELN